MAYIIGTIIWLSLVGISIFIWFSPDGIFFILSKLISLALGIGSTVVYLIYLLIIFFIKRNVVGIWIVVGLLIFIVGFLWNVGLLKSFFH
ncbi:hypothetical protein EDM56_10825 [Brevibacillus fluminis]|uniref:Uncharacterized protein n=1 Tax=Brevibacillus fluminis TaxID=511487 RepID=A0A3M8DNS8_9BACL|nr:hypothetical protein EDM56_10825 [Brevibacillus fluminis]